MKTSSVTIRRLAPFRPQCFGFGLGGKADGSKAVSLPGICCLVLLSRLRPGLSCPCPAAAVRRTEMDTRRPQEDEFRPAVPKFGSF
jgi:hypothetical protein